MFRARLLKTYLPRVQVRQIRSSSREVHAYRPLQARNSPEISGETSHGHSSLVAGRTPHEAVDDDDEDAAWAHEDVDELDEEGVGLGVLDAAEEPELDEEEDDDDELAEMSPEQLAKVLDNEVC